ncbi:GntR family transcriptional regulator [Streptomyces sp. NPDC044571]|uniref:GntR family transcriptional regulator n=1 Tax=Streptomyces sp. NPDC044571 TaxID=3155371 RepID=UPI0033F95E69
MIQRVPSRRHAIADDLRKEISAGRLKAGERLPSEAQLAAHYKVSTPTLRNALALLQSEGLVEKVHGSGNFVRHHLPRVTYLGGGATPGLFNTAHQVSVHTTHLRAQGYLAALLKVSPHSPLTEFFCVTYEGKSPHSVARIYVPQDRAPADMPAGSSLPDGVAAARLAALNPHLAEVQEKVSARLPTPDEATTLRISSTLAVLSITRVATDITGRVVEATLLALPSDRADAVFTTHHTSEARSTKG